MKTTHMGCGMALFFLLSWPNLILGADATNAPAASPVAAAPAGAGVRRGGNNRGGPMTEAEKAEVAKLMELPTQIGRASV